jgi:hypothetical protein
MQAWIAQNLDLFSLCTSPIVRSWDVNLEYLFDFIEDQIQDTLFTEDLVYLIQLSGEQYESFTTTYVRELRRTNVFNLQ